MSKIFPKLPIEHNQLRDRKKVSLWALGLCDPVLSVPCRSFNSIALCEPSFVVARPFSAIVPVVSSDKEEKEGTGLGTRRPGQPENHKRIFSSSVATVGQDNK